MSCYWYEASGCGPLYDSAGKLIEYSCACWIDPRVVVVAACLLVATLVVGLLVASQLMRD